jgi:hypothetical protein
MKITLVMLLMACLCHIHLQGQTQGIKGKVVDITTNENVIGAQVTLDQKSQQTITDATGHYSFDNVPSGSHSITIEYIGFETYKNAFEVKAGENQTLFHSLQPGVFELEAVQVTADPEIASEVISAVDIKLRSIHSSQDVLQLVPGLFIAQHAGGGKAEQIFLRGFDIDHGTDIAITTDGMPVNMVSHAHGQGYADLHYLIPETVDKVHFGKGPYHTHYGNLATAGYVGFQSRNILEESTVALEVGQFNTFRGLGMLNLLNNNNEQKTQNAYIAGEYLSTDGYFESPQNFERISLFGKYNCSLGKNHFLTGSLSTFSSSWDASGQIPLRAVESGEIGFFGAIDDTEGGLTSRSNVNLQLFSTLNSNSFLKNQVYFNKYSFELYSNFTFFLEDSIHGDQIKQKENRNLFGYNGSYQRSDVIGSVGLQTEIGLQYRQDMSDDNELSHTANKSQIIERLAFGDIREANAGIYVNETFRFSDNISINAGLRFDHFQFSYKDQLTDNTFKTVNDQIISPKLNTYVRISDAIQVFGNIGYGFHSNDSRVVVAQQATETLPRALGIDIGTFWKPVPRLIVSGTLWHLDLDQEFVYVGDAAVVEASGRTRRMGIEFSGRWQILEWLYADIDFNYTKAISLEEADGENYIPLAPKLSSIGGLTVQTKNRWSGSIRYRYLGDRPANEDNTVIATGYTVVDGLLSYRINKFEIGISIDNIFDVRWREAQFDTESRLEDEVEPVSEIHFTAGTPFNFRARVAYHF